MTIIRFLTLFTLLLTAPCFAAASQNPLRTEVSLQLPHQHQFLFAGYYAALKKGFYRDVGLDVTILEGGPEITAVDAVVGKQADFGVGKADLLLARAQGKPVVAIAAVLQHSPLQLLTRKADDHSSLSRLLGKPIEAAPDEYELFAFFQAMGYNADDFPLVEKPGGVGNFTAGRVAALATHAADTAYQLDKQGFPFHTLSPRSAGIDFYSGILFTREKLLQQSPELVRAFHQASMKGWRYALSHPEAIFDLIIAAYQPAQSRDQLRFEAQTLHSLIVPDLVEIGYMSRERWRHIADSYSGLALLSGEVDLDRFIYDANLTEEHNSYWLYWSSGAALMLALLFTAIATYILRLNSRLDEKEERYQALYESAPVAILVWDRQCRITEWNQQAEQIFGWRAEEVIGRDFFEVMIPPEETEHVETVIEAVHHSEATISSLNWNLHRSGERILCEWRNTVLHDNNGDITGFIGQALDVTEKSHTEAALRDSERRYRLLAENVLDVIWTMDLYGNFTYISPSIEHLCGFNVEEAMRFKITESLTPDSAQQAESAMTHFLHTGEVLKHEWEMEQYCKDGGTVWVDVIINVVYDEAGFPQEIIGITRDATARRRLEQTLQHMAHYDQLTGLPNRVLFFDRLEHDLSRAKRNGDMLALLFMDLDGFKDANDTHGHDFGDQILREVAQRLEECVRDSDTVARMGGDEFTVTLDHIASHEDAAHIAEKIIAAISKPYNIGGKPCRLGTSIGISLFPTHSDNLEELVSLADAAMYQVKQNGKNSYRFHQH